MGFRQLGPHSELKNSLNHRGRGGVGEREEERGKEREGGGGGERERERKTAKCIQFLALDP